ncbi:MAG: response regulator transcription factor [Acidaminococcales bacterium]|jgi:DNA-binding response OmpR family regulator|nr:response regulator transcription factor [Acidaminococcales bacterium]
MAVSHKNILIVDDETKILEVAADFLQSRGYGAFCAESGSRALEIFAREEIALIILDIMLPDISGWEVCRAVRKKSRVPIIMLTARVEEDDKVMGLELGADDYITKPFGLKELLARVEAVTRRASGELLPLVAKNSFGGGDLVIDFAQGGAYKKGRPAGLTPSEFKILAALAKHPGRVFTRNQLIELALGDNFDGFDRAVDSHVKNLRLKIEDNPKTPVYVLTAHGTGYRFGGG